MANSNNRKRRYNEIFLNKPKVTESPEPKRKRQKREFTRRDIDGHTKYDIITFMHHNNDLSAAQVIEKG